MRWPPFGLPEGSWQRTQSGCAGLSSEDRRRTACRAARGRTGTSPRVPCAGRARSGPRGGRTARASSGTCCRGSARPGRGACGSRSGAARGRCCTCPSRPARVDGTRGGEDVVDVVVAGEAHRALRAGDEAGLVRRVGGVAGEAVALRALVRAGLLERRPASPSGSGSRAAGRRGERLRVGPGGLVALLAAPEHLVRARADEPFSASRAGRGRRCSRASRAGSSGAPLQSRAERGRGSWRRAGFGAATSWAGWSVACGRWHSAQPCFDGRVHGLR